MPAYPIKHNRKLGKKPERIFKNSLIPKLVVPVNTDLDPSRKANAVYMAVLQCDDTIYGDNRIVAQIFDKHNRNIKK
jgi:hypothetical protein